MDKLILKDKIPANRLQYLEETADQVVVERYYQRLSKEELTLKEAEFTANELKIDDLESEKKDVMAEFKENLKPLKEKHRLLADEIRTGFTYKEGRLFKFVEREKKLVYFYNETGELVESKTRSATSEELSNPTIHMELRAGTIR